VSDRAQRLKALATDRSIIVQAPAGSGKTELLTQRFLKLLARVDKPEQVLAITFTRKATQEMRERILQRMQQAGDEEAVTAEHERLAINLAGAVLERDRDRSWGLEDNPGRLQIHTLDGLCARIAGRSPLAGGADGLSAIDDAGALYRKAVQRLVEDVGRPGQLMRLHECLIRVLRHLHGNTGQLLELLAAMLARRDQWLPRMGVDYAEQQQVLKALQELELQRLDESLGAGRIRTLCDELEALAANADDRQAAAGLCAALQAGRQDSADSGATVRAVWEALSAVATGSGTPFSPRSAAARVLPGSADGRERHIRAIRQVLDAWYSDPGAVAAFKRFVSRPPCLGVLESDAILRDFQLLLGAAVAELELLFLEERKADFQYFAGLAMRALGDDFQPGEALLIEDGKLAHILMDEFQDTSQTQFLLLQRLVSGWQPGDGRTLFLVGDPMQSVYRFRQADVRLFNQVFTTGRLGEITLERLVLKRNFRSRNEIIDWVNAECSRVFGSAANSGAAAVRYTAVSPARGRGGRVTVQAWPESAGDAWEAAQIAQLVGERLAVSPGADIAVLARRKSQLVTIGEALQKAGIPFDAVDVEPLGQTPAVLDLLAFTRAILNAADRIAWLALLRGPWCGLAPLEMHALLGDDPVADVLALMGDPAALERLPAERAGRVGRLYECLQRVLAMRGVAPLHRLVEVAWVSSGAPFAAGSQLELRNAQAYLDLLASVEAAGPEDLLEALEERLGTFFSGSRSASVQLLTIHKAKGLEFDTVIMPGLHQPVGGVSRPLLRLHETNVGGAPGVMMAPLKRRGAAGAHLYDYLGQIDQDEEACESMRTLYVALTRAREELFLFGGWRLSGSGRNRQPGCRKGTFMDMLWPCFAPLVDPDSAQPPQGGRAVEPEMLSQLRLRGEPDIATPAPGPPRESWQPSLRLPQREATALGDALHFWLELIHDHWDRDWDPEWFESHPAALESTLRRAGACATRMPLLLPRLQALLKSTLESPAGRSAISPEGKQGSWAELELYSRNGSSLNRNVMDRVCLSGERGYSVLDYKTGETDDLSVGLWQDQLDHYRSLLERCTGQEVDRLSVYHPGRPDLVELQVPAHGTPGGAAR
jgi:ATP-dependent exoDNAse (exonuclease V) beta subunit